MIIEATYECRVVPLPIELQFQYHPFKVKEDVQDQEVITLQNAALELSQRSDNGLGNRIQIDIILRSYTGQLNKAAIFLRRTAKIFELRT